MKKGIYIIIVFATFWCGVLVSNISKVKPIGAKQTMSI